MFSYLAKSLLSKTLNVFLRKYLENIELDAIDYGSAAAASGGTASEAAGGGGYGVRLSNVKLREGMELMKLPGKRKRVARRKREDMKPSKDSSDAVDDAPPLEKTRERTSVDDATPVARNGKKLDWGEEHVSSDASKDTTMGASVGETDGEMLLPQQMQNRERLLTAEELEDGYFSSSPSTPNQNGLCGVPPALCLNARARRGVDLQQSVSQDSTSSEIYQLRPRDVVHVDGKDELVAPNAVETGADSDRGGHNNDAEEPPPNFEGGGADADDKPCIEGEGEEMDVEDDMALVVGSGGMIGTLNIRLVGKELHVTVEDAHLIVEVVANEGRKKPQNDVAKTPNLDGAPSASGEPDFPNPADGSEECGATIGDRIKKKSSLARYLSQIPHLFLRDCRISLILPPEEEGDDESDSCDDCTVLEIGIDFLSVTSGDDILDVLRFDTGNQRTPILRRSKSMGSATPSSSSDRLQQMEAKQNQGSNHIFQRKRIRTGKGPDGGLWLRVHPPQQKMIQPQRFGTHSSGPKWARQQFRDISGSNFFRCSGLDLHARMLIDVKGRDEDALGKAWSREFEDYTMDSALFGVDWIDPDALARHQIREKMKRESIAHPEESAGGSDADSNGIHSIPSASNFHWIAQQKHRDDCSNSQLPLNDCYFCWNKCVRQKSATSPMNDKMPLPGFVFSLSLTDPLEVNVDRCSLEALGYLKSLFTSKKPTSDGDQEDAQKDNASETEQKAGEVSQAPSHAVSSWKFDDKSFPAHMQPDAIYLSGVHVSQVIIHIEALQPTVVADPKFRFWQFMGNSIHYEESQVDSEEAFIRDATFNVGGMELKEYFGVCHRDLLVAGLDADDGVQGRDVQLPFAAARVLGVHSPTLDQQSRSSNAIHVRLIQSNIPKDGSSINEAFMTRYADLTMGIIDVNVDASFLGDISKTVSAASAIFTGKEAKAKKRKAATAKDSRTPKWLLQVSTLGGSLSYRPRVKMQIPRCKGFQMRRDDAGFSFGAFFQALGIEYGAHSFEQPTPPSITPLCSLPESLRMHILLYLGAGDLTALEKVFGTKQKKKRGPVFLRANALNHHISKLKPSFSRKDGARNQSESNRRSNAMHRLQDLDTESLEALLAMHDRSKSK
ncbi:hypothetical protein ACHAXT_002492 [Thalassiosira profunda]